MPHLYKAPLPPSDGNTAAHTTDDLGRVRPLGERISLAPGRPVRTQFRSDPPSDLPTNATRQVRTHPAFCLPRSVHRKLLLSASFVLHLGLPNFQRAIR